jgi:hypothetical protein
MMVPDSPRLRELYFEEIHVLAGTDAHQKARQEIELPRRRIIDPAAG